MFTFNNNEKSHMPFAAPDPQNGFAAREFCCLMVNGKWKIHQFRHGSWLRINTGLPEDSTECSPAAECIDGIWHLTFIAGGAESDRRFRLYHICDLDAGALPVILCPADVGYLQKNTLVHASRRGPILIEKPGKTLKIHIHDAEYLYRVTYDPFHPGRLYISGQTFAGEIFSRICIPSENELIGLQADNGAPAYKAAFWKNDCYYAQRLSNNFEDRQIVRAERLRRTRLSDELISMEIESTKRNVPAKDEEFE